MSASPLPQVKPPPKVTPVRAPDAAEPETVLVVSDTHVTSADPEGAERVERFLRGPATAADRLILAGDLFDFWVSSSQIDDPGLGGVFQALRELVESGVDVGFVEGNRDFAARLDLRRMGVATLPDVLVVETGGRRVVITHGDRLCTKDVKYQAFRRISRTELVRDLLRRMPPDMAMGVGRGARAGSRVETARKAYGDMGLSPLAVSAMLREHDAHAMVCGHVHWGKRYRMDVDGVDRDVIVLSAWENRPTYARLQQGRIDFVRFE